MSILSGFDGSSRDKAVVKTINKKTPDLNGNVNLSADDVNARSGSWIPSADEVGAAGKNHTHTAADVGAAAISHTHSVSELGAAPSSHTHGPTGVTGLSGTDYSTSRVRGISAGTADLTAGTSNLESGTIYLVYE